MSFSGYADVHRCIYGFPTSVLYVHRLFTGIESCIVLITDFCLTWKTLYEVYATMIFIKIIIDEMYQAFGEKNLS